VTLETRLAGYRARVEGALGKWLPDPDQTPRRLHAAMHYAVMGGGKRIRPLLVYLAGEAVAAPVERLDGPASAVELIHAYSLVHDDLPAMDDDDLRRGRPTCHRAFDEATAILAGDALQVLAFQILASDASMIPNSERRIAIVRVLAAGSGTAGMAGGQAIDLAVEGQAPDLTVLEMMHQLKTGALIEASVLMAAWSADAITDGELGALRKFGRSIGLAFQIQDDILDVEGETAVIGKTAGADSARLKPNYPSVAGLAAAKERASQLCDEALVAIEGFDAKADPLRSLARYIVRRDH
jgi:farnesyl diphosphate synthase